MKSPTGLLSKPSCAVNFVFNYCNDRQKDALRFARKHLGWVPLKGRALRESANGFHFNGREFRVFKSSPLPIAASIKDGSNFSQDRRGNWFLNVCMQVPDGAQRPINNSVEIDLGLKDFCTLSNGTRIGAPGFYREMEAKLGIAQRARIVREFDLIAVGDVHAARLAKTNMSRSVLDAGWSSFRSQLAYKTVKHGAWFEEMDGSFNTQTCSNFAAKHYLSPKGIADLGITRWVCSEYGAGRISK